MTWAIDGLTPVVGNAGATITLSLTTTKPNDLIIVAANRNGGDTLLSVVDTAGLTWVRRYDLNNFVVFYAVAPAPLAADIITITYDYGAGNLGWAFAVSGGSPAAPWDTNAALPVFVPGAGFATDAIYSTDSGNDFVLELTALNTGNVDPPTGFTQIGVSTNVTGFYQVVATPQSSTTVEQLDFPSFVYVDALVALPVANYVDLAGNLGGASSYGKGAYGKGLYSRNGAIAPTFAGALDIVGQDYFDGNLAPSITLSGTLSVEHDVALSGGDLAPSVTLAGDLTVILSLAGNLPIQPALSGTLTGLVSFAGDLPVTVVLAGSTLSAGLLWAPSDPCPVSPWAPSDPCPVSMWTPTEPCDPVDWEESELCNG